MSVCVPVVTAAPTMSSILSALRVTAPDDTVKSVASNDATPLLLSVASSAEMVIVLFVTAVSIPSPPVKVNVSPVLKVSLEPLSAASVKDDAAGAAKVDCPNHQLLKYHHYFHQNQAL